MGDRGLLPICEPASPDGEDSSAWLRRYRRVNQPFWSALTSEEWEACTLMSAPRILLTRTLVGIRSAMWRGSARSGKCSWRRTTSTECIASSPKLARAELGSANEHHPKGLALVCEVGWQKPLRDNRNKSRTAAVRAAGLRFVCMCRIRSRRTDLLFSDSQSAGTLSRIHRIPGKSYSVFPGVCVSPPELESRCASAEETCG